jgi:hypothetical protein
MKPQSLSILVPGGCPNDCACCVSKLHDSPYENMLGKDFPELYTQDYYDSMKFAKDNDCHDLIFTGENGECLVNKKFMKFVVNINKSLPNPFLKLELQTSGCYLLKTSSDFSGDYYDNLKWLRETVRIKIISLSLFDIFDSKNNSLYSRPKNEKAYVDIEETCKQIKEHGFTLRLSINMTDLYDVKGITPKQIFERAKELGADQITFRILYSTDNPQTEEETKIDCWIQQNRASIEYMTSVHNFIAISGKQLERLSFGAIRYSVNGISCVVDDNCMGKPIENEDVKEDIKYFILRPNCKLYTRWDDSGSLWF